jgi:hypothetical protein
MSATFRPQELRARAEHLRATARGDCDAVNGIARDAEAMRLLADLLEREPQPQTINIHMDHVHMRPDKAPAFWLVWRDGGKHSSRARFETSIPEVRHAEIASANDEAERLARVNPGVRFYVVPARDYAVAAILPVVWGSATADEVESEPPF